MAHPIPVAPTRPPDRILSVDILRGIVIALMVFVNDIGETRNAPDLLRHVSASADAMHLPDTVFPGFLFMAGMSVPLAFSRALALGASRWALLRKALIRSGLLLLMGVMMVNMEEFEPWPRQLWGMLTYLGFFLALGSFECGPRRFSWLPKVLRMVGVIGLGSLLVCYRTGDHRAMVLGPWLSQGDTVWLRHSWWGILGLIGWAYLVAAIVFLVFGSRREWLVGATGWLLLLFWASGTPISERLSSRRWLDWAEPIIHFCGTALAFVDSHIGIGGTLGSQAAISVAGCALGTLLIEGSDIRDPRERIRWAGIFGTGLFLLGFVTDAPFGINKIQATPAWCMYCAALTTLAWILLYWIIDLKGLRVRTSYLEISGRNPLLAYLIHPFLYLVVGLAGETALKRIFFYHDLSPSLSVVGSLAMSAFVLVATARISAWGYRLKV